MDEYDHYLDLRMSTAYKSALEKLKAYVHPEIVKPFAELLGWACWEENEDAEKIAQNMNLNEDELAACIGDIEWLHDIVNDEREERMVSNM